MIRVELRIAKLQLIYEMVAAQPGISSAEICERLNMPRTSGKPWFRALVAGEHLICTVGKNNGNFGTLPSTFVIGPGGYPTKAPAKIRKDVERSEIPMRRKTVAAVQIGMFRDSLVAALFGEVGSICQQ